MERPAVDHAAASAFLHTRFDDSVDNVVVAPRQGAWSRAYFFRRDGVDFVVRFAPQPDNFLRDRAAGRYASDDLPIPRVTEIGEALGGHYAISERASGEILETLEPGAMREAFPSLLRALDAMRDADVSGTTGYGSWNGDGDGASRSWHGYLLEVGNDPPSTLTHGWRARLATRPSDAHGFDENCERLASFVPACPERRDVIHSDLLYGNVLVADGRVNAVFDWGCALYGDFLYDLAWLTFWAPWYPGLDAIDLRSEALRHYATIGVEVADFTARLRCYELHIGLAGQAYKAFIGDWADFDTTGRRIHALVGPTSGAREANRGIPDSSE